MRKSILERFEEKIFYSPDGCWYWTGASNRLGYGFVMTSPNSVTKKAHRLSYELYKGQIPNKFHVCHSCDNPLCVNPDHLFIGTQQDNMNDMKSKGRAFSNKGEDSNLSKLTNEQVLKIREQKGKLFSSELGKIYNVASTNIQKIWRRQTWKHI